MVDVLMVWHTFMLNPRNFLEDCIRYEKVGLWCSGFPWEAVNACIDNETFTYSASPNARQKFELETQRAWNSLDDRPAIDLECPKCMKVMSWPWTTCDREPWVLQNTALLGSGFADRSFEARCPHCDFEFDHDILRAIKFRKDVELLRTYDYPMPGTFLNKDGTYFCQHYITTS